MNAKNLSFEQMENLEGGLKLNACSATLWGVSSILGLGVTVLTAGTAAVAGWALSTYIGGLSLLCPDSSAIVNNEPTIKIEEPAYQYPDGFIYGH